jgi:hypothetical protein
MLDFENKNEALLWRYSFNVNLLDSGNKNKDIRGVSVR